MPHKQRFGYLMPWALSNTRKPSFIVTKLILRVIAPLMINTHLRRDAGHGDAGIYRFPRLRLCVQGRKDKFSAPKTATKQQVMAKYDFVKQADRVGRLVDTHEFRYLAFDLSRFSEELIETMQQQVADSLVISGNALILRHVYVERKMTPLICTSTTVMSENCSKLWLITVRQ